MPGLLLVAVFVVLGFMLSWIIGIVAREEVSIGRGVAILLCTMVANMLVGFGLQAVAPALATWASLPVSFGVLVVMINVVGEIEWKPAAIVALIYSIVIFLAFFLLGLIAVAGSGPVN